MTASVDLAVSIGMGQRLFMPLVIVLAIAVLALVLRWSHAPVRRRRKSPLGRGLLVPVARVPNQDAADRLAGELRDSGIHATSAPGNHGTDVLVWREDYERARKWIRERHRGS